MQKPANIPSPAIAIVGRHNSGKTTLVEKTIAELVQRGYDVGSVKHHTHGNFEIDYPGKDSYRHWAAGATETVIASPNKIARVKALPHEIECEEIVRSMPGHDIVIVEGYRKSGLPSIEIMRSGNEADAAVAAAFLEAAKSGRPLSSDFVQMSRTENAFDRMPVRTDGNMIPSEIEASGRSSAEPTEKQRHARDIAEKMPSPQTVAVVTDMPEAIEAANIYGLPTFPLDDVGPLATFLSKHYTRPRISVVIQAGGESKRMGQSKAMVSFANRPLICRIIERLENAADDMVITTNEPERLQFVHEMYPELNIRLQSDSHDRRGALLGLCTALEAAEYETVAVVACDMVFASPSLVVAEAIEMSESGADVVVPVNTHGFEPFHAAYRRSVCLPATKRAIERGESRVQSIFEDESVRVLEFPQSRVLQVEPRGGCFINTNTPEELANIEKSYLGE